MTKETKNEFWSTTGRGDTKESIARLRDLLPEFGNTMALQFSLQKSMLRFLMSGGFVLVDLTNLLSYTITLINIFTYQWDTDQELAHQSGSAQEAVIVLNSIQIGLATLLLIQCLIKELPINSARNGYNGSKILYILSGFSSFTLRWRALYLGLCVGSLFHPLVAVFQIFNRVFQSRTGKNVFLAIAYHKSQLVLTIFLLVLISMIYTLIGFFFLNDTFINSSDSSRLCINAIECFMNVLNLGLRSGGGIGDAINPQPYAQGQIGLFVGRFFFDLSFFIIVIILLLNLIFGMIIDAFGNLRDKQESLMEELDSKCVICGIERSEFDKYGIFESHIKREHYFWNYLFYLIYLQGLDMTEYNDVQSYIYKQVELKNLSWIPVGRSISLEKYDTKNENEYDSIKEKLSEMINQSSEALKEIKKSLKSSKAEREATKPFKVEQIEIQGKGKSSINNSKQALFS